jgi:hypothetical protein
VTDARTAGHGGPNVPTLAHFSPSAPRAAAAAVAIGLLVAIIAACGTSGPVVPTLVPVSPFVSSSPLASISTGALPTPWIGSAVFGIEALALADNQIGQATTDLGRAVANEDLAQMRGAADGLAGVDVLLPNMAKLRQEPAMRSFADRYEAAIKAISTSARALRDAIDKGDGKAITSSTQALLAGLDQYSALKGELGDWVQQMPEQKRMNTR